MNRKLLLTVAVAGAVLAACSSGDINIAPETSVTNSNNAITGAGGSENDVCASYTNTGGQIIQGQADGNGNCVYSPAFASNVLPLEAIQTTVFVAVVDLVAGHSGDTELTAQRSHLLAFEEAGYQTHSLIHRFTLFPGHLGSPPNASLCVNYVFGTICKLCVDQLNV